MEPGLVRIEDAAKHLSIGRSTLYELIAQGAIPTVHIGRAARIPMDALKELVKTLTSANGRRSG